MPEYVPNIGLEVHAELSTKTKVFCGCLTAAGAPPNTQTCPVCLGFPGALPALNRAVVEYGLRVALALNCEISRPSIFERKGYYYPDLPKNFQISQKRSPLGRSGWVEVSVKDDLRGEGGGRGHARPTNGVHRVRIGDVHIEEDAAKLLHPEDDKDHSLVDFNRSGIPLLEIVSEPDMHSVGQVEAYMNEVRSALLYLGVSEARMEQGQLRFEASISMRPQESAELGTRVEIKNLNSYRAVLGAVRYEIERQTKALQAGERLVQETRLWDDARQVTEPMRAKETAMDYRYFPEPDLVPLVVDDEWIARVRAGLPEMARQRRRRFVQRHGLSEYDAGILTGDRAIADLFEATVSAGAQPKTAANWLTGRFLHVLSEGGLAAGEAALTPTALAELIALVESNTITGPAARQVFDRIAVSGESPKKVVEELGLTQIGDRDELAAAVDEVIAENPEAAENFRKGKEAALKFLVGQVMRTTKGRANPQMAAKLLEEQLRA